MHPSVAPLASQFQIGTNYFRTAMSRLDREGLLARAGPRSNPPIWIAGHITQFRLRLGNVLGERQEIPWEPLFATGSTVGDLGRYPPGEQVVSIWTSASERLMGRLETLTDGDLSASTPLRVASGDGTLGGAIAYFAFHEAYHLGQLGFLVKWLGEEPLMGR